MCLCVVLVTKQAEAGGLLEHKRLRPTWTTLPDPVSKDKSNSQTRAGPEAAPQETESGYIKGGTFSGHQGAEFASLGLKMEPASKFSWVCLLLGVLLLFFFLSVRPPPKKTDEWAWEEEPGSSSTEPAH